MEMNTMTPPIHASDCSLHNGPEMMPEPCDCGAEPGRTPEDYGSEFPAATGAAGDAPAADANCEICAKLEGCEARHELDVVLACVDYERKPPN